MKDLGFRINASDTVNPIQVTGSCLVKLRDAVIRIKPILRFSRFFCQNPDNIRTGRLIRLSARRARSDWSGGSPVSSPGPSGETPALRLTEALPVPSFQIRSGLWPMME